MVVDESDTDQVREHFGWFGTPWMSYVCYDTHGRLLTEVRKQVPVGELCVHCEEKIAEDDSGKATPYVRGDGTTETRHVHKECLMRMAVGSMAHLLKRCSCFGGEAPEDQTGMTLRQEALAVWEWVEEHGI
jgi:hypothetical protein